jgi:ornithine cyclodeaminase/alanine dehydrogenase-like protein (mu-crystallin family)
MAIKVNNTTVIDDSRNLQNVQGIKTINNTSILGSGNISAGATSTAGAVGAYALCRDDSGSATTIGGSVSASSLYYLSFAYNGFYIDTSNVPSGTWRVMGYSSGNNRGSVFLRIS